MDTKLKNFKHSLIVKALCVILSAVMLFISGYSAVGFLTGVVFYGTADCLEGRETQLTQTRAFYEQVSLDLITLASLSVENSDYDIAELEAASSSTVDEAVKQYKSEKAELIKKHFLETATNYEGYSEPISGENITQAAVDSEAPKNIQDIQKILGSTSGLGFLKYEGYISDDVFLNNSFNFSKVINLSSGNSMDYSYDSDFIFGETETRKIVTEEFKENKDAYTASLKNEVERYKKELKSLVNLKYLIINKNKNIYMTNFANASTEMKNLESHAVYLSYVNGVTQNKGLDAYVNADPFEFGCSFDKLLKDNVGSNDAQIYFYISDKLNEGDAYYNISEYFGQNSPQSINKEIVISLICLAAAVTLLIILLCLCGHKNECEGITLSFIDKVPTDLHFIISIAGIAGIAYLAFQFSESFIFDYSGYYQNLYLSKWIAPAVSLFVTSCWLLFIEWLTSVVRIKKAEKSFFKQCIFVRFTLFIFKSLRRIWRVFLYKPGKFKRTVIIFAAGYFAVNVFLFALLTEWFNLTLILLTAAFNIFTAYKVLKYIKNLDTVIAAAANRSIFADTSYLPESLKILADSFQVTQAELQRAINTAVKDERTKTELITNVSHDLKTPLTSVISYVDLMKKCDITDETALSYLDVLEEKSTKLKRLIEDLIEASKVSSGNVTLNRTKINLAELAVQAIGETNEDFENSGLEVKFIEPQIHPIIIADSQKTYRIIENLLNNAKKYSSPNSRVYITVDKDSEYGIFEIKNFSKEPLNISPDELTERFVRGDSSRASEGSGLGLSIARDLCTLQGGSLKIDIDGDLFKVTVQLPLQK